MFFESNEIWLQKPSFWKKTKRNFLNQLCWFPERKRKKRSFSNSTLSFFTWIFYICSFSKNKVFGKGTNV